MVKNWSILFENSFRIDFWFLNRNKINNVKSYILSDIIALQIFCIMYVQEMLIYFLYSFNLFRESIPYKLNHYKKFLKPEFFIADLFYSSSVWNNKKIIDYTLKRLFTLVLDKSSNKNNFKVSSWFQIQPLRLTTWNTKYLLQNLQLKSPKYK